MKPLMWTVFKRGNLYRVGRYYKTWLRRRWKVEWDKTHSNSGSWTYQVGLKAKACEHADELNRMQRRSDAFRADHWKIQDCKED